MIRAERHPDETIDTEIRGDAVAVLVEAGALVARVVELVADVYAVSYGIKPDEGQLKAMSDILDLASHRLEAARAKRGDKTN